MPWNELRYVLYAKAWGWTPDQVDEIPLHLEPWLLPINSAIDQVAHERSKAAQSQAGKSQKGRHRR